MNAAAGLQISRQRCLPTEERFASRDFRYVHLPSTSRVPAAEADFNRLSYAVVYEQDLCTCNGHMSRTANVHSRHFTPFRCS
jgi:hypothetical protein